MHSLTYLTLDKDARQLRQPDVDTFATQISGGTGANSFSFNRLETITSPTSPVGMWAFESATDLSAPHLVFFSNGRFMQIQHIADSTCANNSCPPGVEFSEYSYDAVQGIVSFFNLQYDTNGCAGLFESCTGGTHNTTAQRSLTLAPDGQTAVVIGGDGLPHTLYRVAAQ